MGSFKSIFIFLSLAALTACSSFGGVSIRVEPKEITSQSAMTLTIPERDVSGIEDKTKFLKLIKEAIQTIPQKEAATKERVMKLKDFSKMLEDASSEQDLYRMLKSRRNRVVDEVLFTGYFKPLFEGSLKRSQNYNSPLYSFSKNFVGKTRKELNLNGHLKSNELIFLKDPFEAFLAEVQGSVGVKLESGQVVHLAFAGSNGQEYRSIGAELVADRKLSKAQATIPGIRSYFESHPEEMQEYIFRNPRMIFFDKSLGKALGSTGVDLLSERAVATDNSIYPAGTILFVSVAVPARGDSVVLVKDLKIKGSSGALKKGTKVKNIRIIDPIDGHNIACKIDGFGALNLKSEFVKKV